MQYWLVKSEPEVYPLERLKKEKTAVWDGVRNYAARNNLNAMKVGDKVLYYHSGGDKAIVGMAVVKREAFPDPTTKETAWVAVELGFEREFKNKISLAEIKSDMKLKNMELVRLSRLSVSPVRPDEFDRIVTLANT